ncbi:formyltransferase family protein [Candidatus Pelagibacter sp.]|nr:formyltransferase family protein [Candidatus Pelagibacter sp.]
MKKIKIGIIINGNFVDKYTNDLAIWLISNKNKFISTSFISIKENEKKDFFTKKFFKKILFKLIIFIENIFLQLHKNHKNHLERYDLRKIIKNKIILKKYQKNKKYFFKQKDIEKVKLEKFDILIRSCADIIPKDLLNVAKEGVLSFHHGDHEKFRGSPAGFWEVFFREISTGFMIQKIDKNLDYGKIILKGKFQTKSFFLLNQAELYQKSNFYIKKIILDFYKNKKFNFIDKGKKGKIFETPKIINQIKYLFQTFFVLSKKKFGKQKLFSLVFFEENFLSKPFYLKNKSKKFLADPFLFKKNNQIFCFAEEYDFKTKKGHIVCMKYEDYISQDKKIIISEKFHLSFPYIFDYAGNTYMVPDTSEISEIRLYKCTSFPYKWKFHKTLLKNIKAADSMIFKKNKIWWLFTNIDRSSSGDFTHDFSIFYSKNGPLSSKWHIHPFNPIKINSLNSRNGGLISDKNKLFRISQKQGFDNYGEEINFHLIKSLTPKKYIEKKTNNNQYEKIKKILKNKNIHHISKLDNKIVLDFK